MATVDFTLEDLKQVFATKDDLKAFATKEELRLVVGESTDMVLEKLAKVSRMLEEDAVAEAKRISRVDRRSLKTAQLLDEHVANDAVHFRAI